MRQTLAAVITTAMAAHAPCAQARQPIHLAAEPFTAPQVRLLDGPFAEAQARDAEYLLSLDPDRLLARFRADAGLDPRAEGYGGWETEGIGGHTLGHYLSAISKMFAATGDRRFQDRAADIVAQLAECQAANGDGYVAAIPDGRRVFAEVARGDIRTKGFDLNGVWVPWYTLHKELAGLRDANLYCGNTQALAVMRGLEEWALRTTDSLSPEQLNTMLRCEQGGMNEVAADLYALIGDANYLTLAERFNDHQVLDPLAAGRDILPGLHANTQIPKLIGAARQHELTNNPALGAAAEFFWQTVTAHHSYATGGNSLNEYFGPPGVIGARLDGNTTETCNTYNMLRLTRRLHSWTADAAYIDYYERALYNHILASQNHDTGAVCYYVPLRPGSQKPYQQLDSDFTCCVGTGMENHASYGDMIYSHDDEGIFVNLFIASTLRWPDAGLALTQRTRFPDEPATTLTLTLQSPREGVLRIRHPAWAEGRLEVELNGASLPLASTPGAYAVIRRVWADGDTLTVHFPMPIRVEPTPDDPAKVALFAGPILLAGDLGSVPPSPAALPSLLAEDSAVTRSIDRVEGPALAYRTRGLAKPSDLELIPFFRVRDDYYSVYWPLLTPDQWRAQLAQIRAEADKRRHLEARTADFVQPGEMQLERDHDFDGERTNTGEHRGLRWRDAYRGGWFAFTMKLPNPAADPGPATLVCTYWGDDDGDREFDILIDDEVLATQTLDRNQPGEFFDVRYPIPDALTRDKHQIRVKFLAHPGKTAGGLFGCRILRSE